MGQTFLLNLISFKTKQLILSSLVLFFNLGRFQKANVVNNLARADSVIFVASDLKLILNNCLKLKQKWNIFC